MTKPCSPETCLTKCPYIQSVTEHIDRHNKEQDNAISLAVSDAPEHMAEVFATMMPSLNLDTEQVSVSDVGHEIREITSGSLDALTQHIRSLEAIRASVMEKCTGALGMQAVRGRIKYSVKVCTSPRAPLGKSLEQAQVSRKYNLRNLLS